MKLAFYKAPGTLFDKLIRLATRSAYSHCEIVIDGMCYSSSARDGGVRRAAINVDSGHWDVIDIPGDPAPVLAWFSRHDGAGYDWLGLARCVIPFFPHAASRWFCSEACGSALGLDASSMSPQDLFESYR